MSKLRQLVALSSLAFVAATCARQVRTPATADVVLAGDDVTADAEPNDEPAPPMVKKWLVPSALSNRVAWVTPACVDRVQRLVRQMTPREKFGQMMLTERRQLIETEDIKEFHFGAVLSGGGSSPRQNVPAAWLDLVRGYADKALETRLQVPLLYGVDAVHGHNNVFGATIFPHNIGLGATRDQDLVMRVARATAREVRATGIDWTFAPVLAAARDERWGRTYEAFGETAELASDLGSAAIRGYQGVRLGADGDGVLACAKHFVGDGGTYRGRDQGNALVSAEELLRDHLQQYEPAIAAGVGSVMVSFSSVNGQKMHANRALLTDVLKERMKFQGFLVSDMEAIGKLPGDFRSQIEQSINAGLDMVMGVSNYRLFHQLLAELVPARIPMERIDDAVTRILTVKCEMGLFESARARPQLSVVGSTEHRQLAREAVRKSLVLLVNRAATLPLAKSLKHIHVAGKSADNIGNQCGGWTIDWQGQSGPITIGTTIRKAVSAAVSPGTKVTYSIDGKGAGGSDAVIVVVGERPYAEFEGDVKHLELDPADLAAIDNAKASGARVVVVLISGRPLPLGALPQTVDAVVAAWLPGSEGQGVADILFGDAEPTGKLGHSWPKDMSQVPINVGDPQYQPLFPYGYGLTYTRELKAEQLAERALRP